MTKFRIFISFEKEEAWLREMAQKGWRFTGRGTFLEDYQFEKAEPRDLNIRVDYRYIPADSDFSEYLQLLADSGWNHIYGGNTGAKYFASASGDAEEELFSDNASKAGRYRRQSKNAAICFLIFFPLMLYTFRDLIMTLLRNPGELFRNPSLLWNDVHIIAGLAFLANLVIVGLWLYSAIGSYLEGKKLKAKG